MNKYKFDLQLFADGDDTATPVDSQETSFVEQIRSNDEADKLAAIRQWRTQSETPVQEEEKEEVEQEQEQEETLESEETPTQEQNLDLDADDFEKIDPNKLSPENFKIYKHMERLMQKKSQELSQKGRELEALKTQVQQLAVQQPQQPVNPLAQAEQDFKVFTHLFEQKYGTPYNEFDEVHRTVWIDHRDELKAQRKSEAYLQQKTDAIVREAQQNPEMEADFDASVLDLLAKGQKEKANMLYAAKSRFIFGMATAQDIDMIEQHWNGVKAAKNTPKPVPKPVVEKPKIVPPKLEKSGVEQQEMKPTVNMNSFKAADYESKLEMIKLARRNGQI